MKKELRKSESYRNLSLTCCAIGFVYSIVGLISGGISAHYAEKELIEEMDGIVRETLMEDDAK